MTSSPPPAVLVIRPASAHRFKKSLDRTRVLIRLPDGRDRRRGLRFLSFDGGVESRHAVRLRAASVRKLFNPLALHVDVDGLAAKWKLPLSRSSARPVEFTSIGVAA